MLNNKLINHGSNGLLIYCLTMVKVSVWRLESISKVNQNENKTLTFER